MSDSNQKPGTGNQEPRSTMAGRIRKDDVVEVIAGDHKGERGKVLKVLPKEGLV
ncbi:MAG: hypothetical protein AMXMBFR83_27700 [Phycisphaerae bacterium]